MTPETRAWIRSPRGQMSLLGAVYAGSVLFSIACVLVRGAFFEKYVYDDFEPVPAHLETVSAEQLAVLPAEDRRTLYGRWIDTGSGTPPEELVDRPGELHGWVRGTLVTGNPDQRRAATAILPALVGHGIDADVHESAEYALRRSRALRDPEWEAEARAVLDSM